MVGYAMSLGPIPQSRPVARQNRLTMYRCRRTPWREIGFCLVRSIQIDS